MTDTETNITPADNGGIFSDAGQSLVEYALILAFVSIVAVTLTPLGTWVSLRLADITAAL